uniref:VACUOLAR PROTEIN SORTING PROTEIN 36 n=1 Tax=Saccharomyces cerevisiae TaxID=4932 RepID=UPI0000D5BE37|nr:Chain A, VACUOLAR PROTEIN SORTING PROTEIN 36 [Saccharomyces cerevisiae]2CAY_B Chain B, VACUOLAR PROTEIN SORTING PROTEIN 36 [Saccharomyces cerevisiae]
MAHHHHHHMEYWHYVETTSSGQPLLREGEKDIFIDQSVGLYHGKSKILQRQRGRIFLTSQRIIYIDDAKPTQNSLGLELDDLAYVNYSSGFLTRSPRLILFFKDPSSSTEFVQLSFRKSDGVLFSQATERALENILTEKNKHIFN